MELELGLKLTRVANEFSSADFQFAKDRSGPVFISTETDRSLILTAHLKGYRKQDIKIEINEDGSRIIIRGEKTIQETVLVGWKLYKKETEMRRFSKAFKIPDGVILDKIKAKFNEDESILTISMPKKEKGIRGLSIEEVEEKELRREGSENLQIVPDEVPQEENVLDDEHKDAEAEDTEETGFKDENSTKGASVEEPKESAFNVAHPEETQVAEVHDTIHTKVQEKKEDQLDQRMQKVSDDYAHETDRIKEPTTLTDEVIGGSSVKGPIPEGHNAKDGIPQMESGMHRQDISPDIHGKTEEEADQNQHTGTKQETDPNQRKYDEIQNKGNDIQREEEESSAVIKPPEEAQEGLPSSNEEKERCKLCTPILAGSALLLSLVVFVIHFIRSKSQPGKRKN